MFFSVPVGFFPRCRFPAWCFVRCFFVVAVSVSVVPGARLSFVVCFLWARGRRKSLFSPSYLRRPQIFLPGLWSSEVFSELSKTNFFFGASPKPPGHGGCTSSHFSEVFCSVPPFYFFRVFNKLAKSLFLYFFRKSGGTGSNAAKLSTLSKKYGGTAGVRSRASQKCSPPSKFFWFWQLKIRTFEFVFHFPRVGFFYSGRTSGLLFWGAGYS